MMINPENETKPALPLWARILLVIIAYIILTGVFQLLGMLILHIPLDHQYTSRENITLTHQIIMSSVSLIPLAFIIYIFRRFLDRQTLMSMGFSIKNRFKDISAGFLIALSLFVGGSLILILLNSIGITFIRFDPDSFLMSLLLFVMVALNEEILMRGYILNNLMASMNKYRALLISATIFSVLHGLNPNISFLAIINLMLAGIILGSSYIFTKNLWFPISLHLFWNFFQGPVLGYSVSGMKIDSVFKVTLPENTFVNGGQFGFEGSIVCTILLIPAIILIMGYYLKYSNKDGEFIR
jgi:membrane protease YdiL (CAAX protease family)